MTARSIMLPALLLGAIGLLLASGAHWASSILVPLGFALAIRAREAQLRARRRGAIAARRAARASSRELALERARVVATLRAILDRVDAPVLVTDDQGEIVHANASSATLLGRRREELAGRALADLFSQSALVSCCESALEGEPSRARVSLSILARPRTFDASAIPLHLEGRTRAVLTLRDVTDLATANRLKTDFVANASHELRTPVAAIKGSVETLEDAMDDPPMRDRLISIIGRNAKRLEDLLADLLELGRLESQQSQPPAELVDVRELLNDIASAFDARCQRRSLRFEWLLDDAVRSVRLNRRLIEIVLSNLMDNATRFAHERTACEVRVRRAQASQAEGDVAMGELIRFEVSDTGAGIPLADQARIFERFYQVSQSRTRAETGGTGLGLSIVKHAVHLLGGQVGVESVLHQGSTFWVEVPEDLGSSSSLGVNEA